MAVQGRGQEFIPAKDHLAAFLGDFTFYAGVLALMVQLLVTSRFLRRFGIGLALCTLPVGLIAASAYMLLMGTLLSAILLRGADWVWRYSIDKSTVELLYLPLSSRIKFQVKWFIDTVIWRMGTGLAGVTVLFFVTYLELSARRMNWVVLVLLGAWLCSAWVARKQYVATLTESIREHRVATEPPVLDRSTTEVLTSSLSVSDAKEVLYALNILESGQRALHPPIRVLLRPCAVRVCFQAALPTTCAPFVVEGERNRRGRDDGICFAFCESKVRFIGLSVNCPNMMQRPDES